MSRKVSGRQIQTSSPDHFFAQEQVAKTKPSMTSFKLLYSAKECIHQAFLHTFHKVTFACAHDPLVAHICECYLSKKHKFPTLTMLLGATLL